MRNPKDIIMRLLVFLRFFFPELSRLNQILYLLQFIFFIASIVLACLHIDRLNFVVYFLGVAVICCMGMQYMQSNSFKI
mgnify:CR=1 FL=1